MYICRRAMEEKLLGVFGLEKKKQILCLGIIKLTW